MRDQLLIWAKPRRRKRPKIGCTNASFSHIPYRARQITIIERVDKNIMLDWIHECLDKGWSLERIRDACE